MPVFDGIPEQQPRVFAGQPANLNALITQSGMTQEQRAAAGALSESPPLGNSLVSRSLAGIKRTPQGKLGFLESKFGAGNVVSEGEDFFIQQNGQWFRLDPKGFDFPGDIADATGEIISGLPAAITGFATANPATAVAAGAAGESVRGAISNALPGDDGLSIGNQLARVGTNAALSGAAQFGANKLTQGIDSLAPSNILARSVEKGMRNPAARNNLAISQKTGIPLDAAQITESKQLEGLAGFSRMHPFSANTFRHFDEIVAEKSVQRLTGLLDDLSKGGSAIQAGVGVGKAYRGTVQQVLTKRTAQAAKDFGKVKLLSRGEKFIKTDNTLHAITELINDFDVPGGGDVASTLVKRLNTVSKEISEDGFTASQMQRLLEIYGKASRGTGQLFRDIDKGQQRLIARKVFGALQRDLDEAVETGAGGAASALRTARDNWRLNSQPLNELEENVLGRIFGGKFDPAPEKIIKKFSSMAPSEVKAAMEVLDPVTSQLVKREFLSEGVDKAVNTAGGNFSPRLFNSWFNKNKNILKTMMTPDEFRQSQITFHALQKVAQRGGVDGSQTAKWFMAWDVAKNLFTFNPVSIMSTGIQAIAPRTVAKAMTTQPGRNAVVKVITAKKPTQAVIKAASYLMAIDQGAVDAVSSQLTGPQPQALQQ